MKPGAPMQRMEDKDRQPLPQCNPLSECDEESDSLGMGVLAASKTFSCFLPAMSKHVDGPGPSPYGTEERLQPLRTLSSMGLSTFIHSLNNMKT